MSSSEQVSEKTSLAEAPITVVVHCFNQKCSEYVQIVGALIGFSTPAGVRGWTPIIGYPSPKGWMYSYNHLLPKGWEEIKAKHYCPSCAKEVPVDEKSPRKT